MPRPSSPMLHAMCLAFAALLFAPAMGCGDGGDDEDPPTPIDLRDAAMPYQEDGSAPSGESDSGSPVEGSDAGGGAGDASSPDSDSGTHPENYPAVNFGFDASRVVEPSSLSDDDMRASAHAAATSEDSHGLKNYTLSTTGSIRTPLDGGEGVRSPRTVSERQDSPRTRTQSPLFDGLYALAVEELQQNAVSRISDGSFDNGAGMACGGSTGCFETGRDWHYVWTRDTAFAAALGISPLSPARTAASLEFKLSGRRDASGGSEIQIVQDTGSGGSWPVSTDRVSWAFGAEETLRWLSGSARTAFRDKALSAISATLEHDRVTVFDKTDGLYFGETSFIDWRENTYPEWMGLDPSQIAESKSLSTNLLHMKAMEVAAALSEEAGKNDDARRYREWAASLKTAVRAAFKGEGGRWASFLGPELSGAVPSAQMDALAVSFAVLFGAAEGSDAEAAIAAYPHMAKGIPVIYPQQFVPIYHNMAHWPFVTAFFARAAQEVGNDHSYDFAVLSMIRGSALNLTNMENFALLTGLNWQELNDSYGNRSGPVVNSQRQLWSVAGYLSLVQNGIFGIGAGESGGLVVSPHITAILRHTFFRDASAIELRDFPVRGGGKLDVVVELPPLSEEAAQSGGFYSVERVTLDGAPLEAGSEILKDGASEGTHAHVVVTLAVAPRPRASAWTYFSGEDLSGQNSLTFAPATTGGSPYLGECDGQQALTLSGGHPELNLKCASGGIASGSNAVMDVYRNGVLTASSLPKGTEKWLDEGWNPASDGTSCYTVRYREVKKNGEVLSHDSKPVCFWGTYGTSGWHIQEFGPESFAFSGGSLSDEHGMRHLGNSWGKNDSDYLEVEATAQFDGEHFVQLRYANGTCALNTGVTCGVKQVRVTDKASGQVVSEGYVALPAVGQNWDDWRDSTNVRVSLVKGHTYKIRIGGDGRTPSRAVNMSAFSHFAKYTGNDGMGGINGVLNVANIAMVKLLAMGK